MLFLRKFQQKQHVQSHLTATSFRTCQKKRTKYSVQFTYQSHVFIWCPWQTLFFPNLISIINVNDIFAFRTWCSLLSNWIRMRCREWSLAILEKAYISAKWTAIYIMAKLISESDSIFWWKFHSKVNQILDMNQHYKK